MKIIKTITEFIVSLVSDEWEYAIAAAKEGDHMRFADAWSCLLLWIVLLFLALVMLGGFLHMLFVHPSIVAMIACVAAVIGLPYLAGYIIYKHYNKHDR